MDDLSPDAIKALTPEQAGVELTRLTEEYKAAQLPAGESVEGHIARLSQDKGFADALFNGSVQARAKFDEAFKALKDGPAPPVSDIPPAGYRSVVQQNEVDGAAVFRSKGLAEDRIAENLSDFEYPPEEVARAKLKWAQLTSDPEWRKRFDAGGLLEYDQWLAVCRIIRDAR